MVNRQPKDLDDHVEAWVDSFQRGEDPEGSFRQLFEHHHRLLLAFFRRRGFSAAWSEDLAQETFLSAYRGLGGFRRRVPFRSWLFSLAINVFRQHLRRQGAGKRAGRAVPLSSRGAGELAERGCFDTSELGGGAQQRLLSEERLGRIRESLNQLPPRMRRCALLRWYHEYAYKEIARRLGISPAAARVHVFKARRRILRALADPPSARVADREGGDSE